jgi:hypothetical protein
MLLTVDCLYVVTTSKKGRPIIYSRHYQIVTYTLPAKHLEQLKGGRFPIEILVRGKDAAENVKTWAKITDTIQAAGV